MPHTPVGSVHLSLPPAYALEQEVIRFAEQAGFVVATAPSAELIGNLLHHTGWYTLNDHLHQRQHQGFLVALIALKELRLKGILTVAGNLQLERTHTRSEPAFVRAITVSAALLRLLARGRTEVLGHLSLEQLVKEVLVQYLHAALTKKDRLGLLL